MILRPDLLDEQSPQGLEVFQLTAGELPHSHIYMEAQVFTPDSKRLILRRSGHAHAYDPNDPRHAFLLCDLEDRGGLRPLTEERGCTAPSVSPDGRWLYYFVDETDPDRGRLTLKRVPLDGIGRETLFVLDSPLPGMNRRPWSPYPLSTLSSDGRRLAISASFGARTSPAPFGLLVFDLDKGQVSLAVAGDEFCNMHPQYCRSLDDDASHDILIQENHGCQYDEQGHRVKLTGGAGADIHVIRDDGACFRDLPWGRDGIEFCQGHQCWRGRATQAITSTIHKGLAEAQLVEGQAAPHAGHAGLNTPGGRRHALSRQFLRPQFYHFATDIAGRRLITDFRKDPSWDLYAAELPEREGEAVEQFTYLLRTRSSLRKECHVHPFLSPDGAWGFFNSDVGGVHHAYAVTGF